MKKIHNFVHILRIFNRQSSYPTSMERSKNLNLSNDKWKMWVNKPNENKRYRSAASMGSFLIRFIGRASTAAVVFASAFSSFTFSHQFAVEWCVDVDPKMSLVRCRSQVSECWDRSEVWHPRNCTCTETIHSNRRAVPSSDCSPKLSGRLLCPFRRRLLSLALKKWGSKFNT